MLLACIAGKDRSQKIYIGRDPVRIDIDGGYMILSGVDGVLDFDGQYLGATADVNGQAVGTARLRAGDVLRVGDSIWRVLDEGKAGVGQGFSHWIGLDPLKDFRLADIFSEVLKKHSVEEMEDQLITGTSRHTPSLEEIETGWARPWLFARLLGLSAVLAFMLYEGYEVYENINLIPGLIFVGSFAVPASALVFFLEMNAPRNVSIFTVMGMVFIGGVASLIVSLVLYSRISITNSWVLALAAGIVEETAKLSIVVLLTGKARRYPWILNGLLLGAAVGTGFAVFESAGYALRTMMEEGFQSGAHNIVLRGLLAPFGHIVWTANAAAALWLVKGNRPFAWSMLQDPAFLRIAGLSVVCHILWDAPFTLLSLPVVLDLKYVALGVLAWIICFRLVQAGLKQLGAARQELAPVRSTP
jgi:protease PrsW